MEKKWINQSITDDNKIPAIGLSIIPVSTSKVPYGQWGEHQSTEAPVQIWHDHFLNEGTVGIICGMVSRCLECIDFDLKNDPYKTIWKEFVDLIPKDLFARLIVQTTPHGGFHVIYRCSEVVIEKSQKLALHIDKTVIIETRGEGGYFCHSKINNQVVQGKFDLENLEVEIPIITAKEREFLLESARSLTRYFPSAVNDSKDNAEKPYRYKEPAINDFNEKYDIVNLLIKHGWSVVKEDNEKLYLLREGSSAAYSGYYFVAKKTFFCFSTSTEFTQGKAYNHFQVLQTLDGNNDYRSTLRLLPEYGFQIENSNIGAKTSKISADDIAKFLNDNGVVFDSFIQDLTINNKVIEEMKYNTLFIDLKKHFNKEIPRSKFEEIIKSDYINKFNPIEAFIEKHKDRHPVGMFKQWLQCMELKNKAIDPGSVVHFLKKWYTGMIAQALSGEYPNEFFLTLLSIQQGIGKTSFLRKYTLPSELQNYRVEHSLSTDDDFKVIMAQSLLVIDDEMDGRNYEMDQTFKSILSTKLLTMRRKYDRRISTISRRCTFAGSGNNLSVVREQQNRRIIPIEVKKFHYDKLDKLDLTDLFMEAYHLYANGYHYSYTHDDKTILQELYSDYVVQSDLDMIIDENVELPDTINNVFAISCLDLVTTLSREYPAYSRRINVTAVGKLMKEKGFNCERRGKARTQCYLIDKNSKIVGLMGNNNVTWELLPDNQLDKINNNKKINN